MPIVVVIWFFSGMRRGWEQFVALVWKVVSEGPPGAHPEIVVLNISGHDMQIDTIRFAEHRDHFTRPLEAERENDPNRKIVHDGPYDRTNPRATAAAARVHRLSCAPV